MVCVHLQNRLAFYGLSTGNIPFKHTAGEQRMGFVYESTRADTGQNHGSVLFLCLSSVGLIHGSFSPRT